MRPPKPTRPPKLSDADRVVYELHLIHIELSKLREAIGALPDIAEQQRLDGLASRLSAATNALRGATEKGD